MVIKALDVGIAAVLVCLGVVQLVSGPPDHARAAAVLTLGMTMPMLARRWRPIIVSAAVSAAVGTYALMVAPEPPFAGFIALLISSYTLMRQRDDRLNLIGYGAIVAAVACTGLVQPTAALDWLYPLVYLGGAAVVGRFVRLRAEQHDTESEQQVRLAVVEERSRIARELHDVVAHGLGVMVLHAEAADELLESDPGAARSSLLRIQDTGREAVGELTLMLALLRTAPEIDDHLPQPMLAQLPALVADVSSPSRKVALTTSGDLGALPTGIQLTAFRIVQEALTNVVKHSAAQHVQVTVQRNGHGLSVTVLDSGPRLRRSAGTGHGLVGMRERANLYGGSLHAGPMGDGFTIRLAVPLP